LENVDQAFFSVDMVDLKIKQMSVACEKIYGYAPEAFFEDPALWKGLIYKDDLAVVDKEYAALFSGRPIHQEYRIVHRDQSIRWVEAKAVPTLDANGKLIRIDGVVYDVGKRKTAELERDLITSDLTHRNKDLEQFTYIVSHNLRAPVANIMGLTSLLDITVGDSNIETAELLHGLSVSIHTLDSVILDLNQILAVRTPGFEKKESVSLYTIVDDIRASIKHLIDKEHVVIDCDFEEVETVFALRSYIYSIFYNLILNSVKYKHTSRSPVISIKSTVHNNKTILLFKDNGKGIDLQRNGKEIFMLYKRFDTSVEGKGIGLYMIKTAIETLGGTISIESQLHKGSEFRVELPNKHEEHKALNGASTFKLAVEAL
jgi:PAS domain S-box-containing protein